MYECMHVCMFMYEYVNERLKCNNVYVICGMQLSTIETADSCISPKFAFIYVLPYLKPK